MPKPYPYSRFLRHVQEAAEATNAAIIKTGVQAEGRSYSLRGVPDNELFLWLDWLESRTPLREHACWDFPQYPECAGMTLQELYECLHALTHDPQPAFDC